MTDEEGRKAFNDTLKTIERWLSAEEFPGEYIEEHWRKMLELAELDPDEEPWHAAWFLLMTANEVLAQKRREDETRATSRKPDKLHKNLVKGLEDMLKGLEKVQEATKHEFRASPDKRLHRATAQGSGPTSELRDKFLSDQLLDRRHERKPPRPIKGYIGYDEEGGGHIEIPEQSEEEEDIVVPARPDEELERYATSTALAWLQNLGQCTLNRRPRTNSHGGYGDESKFTLAELLKFAKESMERREPGDEWNTPKHAGDRRILASRLASLYRLFAPDGPVGGDSIPDEITDYIRYAFTAYKKRKDGNLAVVQETVNGDNGWLNHNPRTDPPDERSWKIEMYCLAENSSWHLPPDLMP